MYYLKGDVALLIYGSHDALEQVSILILIFGLCITLGAILIVILCGGFGELTLQ